MISIIICARTADISQQMKENISSTIGTDYELIIMDNSQKKYSIYTAYNEGVRKSRGTVLCFMHDDIVYHSKDWGIVLENYFNSNPNVGMAGVIGSHFMPNIPTAWWEPETTSGQLIQGSFVNGNYSVEKIYKHYNKATPTKVAAIDGLWMCIPRSIFKYVRWDDCTFSGFHGYDLDMSFQIQKAGYDIHILWDVVIEHKSMGDVQETFYNTIESVYKKWQEYLPIYTGLKMSEGEQEARTRLVEVKHELRQRHNALKQIYSSPLYRISQRFNLTNIPKKSK